MTLLLNAAPPLPQQIQTFQEYKSLIAGAEALNEHHPVPSSPNSSLTTMSSEEEDDEEDELIRVCLDCSSVSTPTSGSSAIGKPLTKEAWDLFIQFLLQRVREGDNSRLRCGALKEACDLFHCSRHTARRAWKRFTDTAVNGVGGNCSTR